MKTKEDLHSEPHKAKSGLGSDASTCSVCSLCGGSGFVDGYAGMDGITKCPYCNMETPIGGKSFRSYQFENEANKQMGEICETLHTHPMIDGDTTANSVELLLTAYKKALHDAIASPMGVVPESAEELYDQNYYSFLPNVKFNRASQKPNQNKNER